jgi:S-adenosylmethionine synthetase
VAGAISDSILDTMTAEDKNSEVVCETLVTTDLTLFAVEITTDFYVDIPELIREIIFARSICNRGQL